MEAVLITSPGCVAVQTAAIPEPGPNQILVRVHAAAQNPLDWKCVHFLSRPGTAVGCDFVGVVAKLGPGVLASTRHVGERVAGFINGSGVRAGDGGTFADYVVADAQVIVRIPESMSWAEGASFGVAAFTACQVLHQTLGFSLDDSAGSYAETPILIWSAASSVGQFAVQLAKYLQLRVIATASTANHSLLRKLGADIVLDYSGLDTVEQIRTAAQCQLRHAIDCVCDLDSATRVSDCFGSEGGIVATLLMYQGEQLRANVDARPSLCFTLLGRATELPKNLPALPQHYLDGVKYASLMSTLIISGSLRGNPALEYYGGWHRVQEGLDVMKAGNVRAAKLVHMVQK